MYCLRLDVPMRRLWSGGTLAWTRRGYEVRRSDEPEAATASPARQKRAVFTTATVQS